MTEEKLKVRFDILDSQLRDHLWMLERRIDQHKILEHRLQEQIGRLNRVIDYLGIRG